MAIDKLTAETYNRLARAYDAETIGFWEEFPPTTFEAFMASAPGNRVLDIGSGPGRDGLILKEVGFEVTCLDASIAMTEMCRQRGLNALVGDFGQLPFADESFDGAWAYTSLLHVPKELISPALSEIRRVLRPEGVFGLGMIEGTFEGYRESAGVNQPRWFSYYGEDELNRLLQGHGFQVTFSGTFQPRTSRYLNFVGKKQ